MQKVFEVLFDQLEKLKYNNPGQRPPSHYLDELGKMPPNLLKRVLEGYSAPALQAMAQARGLDALRKRANLEQELSKHFYDTVAIDRLLNKLSGAAREGLYHIKRMGGLISLESWRRTLESRYGKQVTDQAQAELIGGLLALYGAVPSYGGIDFSFPYKNDLTTAGSFGAPVYLWTHSKVLNLFQVNPAEAARYMDRDRPLPYSGKAPVLTDTPGFDSLLADMVSTTRYFEQNKVGALVSGEPGKRDFVKLNEGLSVKEPGEIKSVKKIEDLGRLYFLWTLLKETQLVTQRMADGVFQANPAAGEEFFGLPRYRQARLLAGAWVRCGFSEFKRVPTLRIHRMSYYESSLPDDRKIAQARLFLLGLLDFYRRQGSLLPGEWLDFSRLVSAVRDLDINFLVNHDFSVSSYRENSRYGYDYDPVFPTQGYYGDEFYAGLTSTLKLPPKTKGGFRLPEEGGAPLKLSEDFALVEGEWLAQVFAEPLAWLGLAELGRDDKGRPLAFRLTDLGVAALTDQPSERERQQADQFRQLSASHGPELTNALLVQPNFDVMVLAPLENLTLLRQVDRFASQTSMGDVALYHISKDSVLRGLRGGLRGNDIIQTLRENNRVPVASNVVQTIEDWAVEFERLVLYENCHLLETPDAATLDRLMVQPGAERYVVKRLGPTFALVTGELARPVSPPKPAKPGSKEILPLYLNYQSLQPGSVSLEGTNLLKVKPVTANPYLFYRLGQFAELETWNSKQGAATFRLSARAGQRAQHQGLTYDSVIQFLAMVLPKPTRRNDQLPPETTLALKGWLGYYGPVQAEKALTLQVAQGSQLAEIFELEEFKPALLGWAGPNIALVRESHFPQLAARLADLGMPVNKPGAAALPASTALAVVEEKSRRGKRAVSEETTAERERKAREREEAKAEATPNLLARQAGPGKVRQGPELAAIMDLLDLMAGTGVAPDELERMLDDLDEGEEFVFPTRSRKKRDRDY